jgi:hypothetical protein
VNFATTALGPNGLLVSTLGNPRTIEAYAAQLVAQRLRLPGQQRHLRGRALREAHILGTLRFSRGAGALAQL